MKRNEAIGILAGIASGAAYGLNPVFGKPLMAQGVSVSTMLFVRYVLAMLIVAAILLIREARRRSLPVQILPAEATTPVSQEAPSVMGTSSNVGSTAEVSTPAKASSPVSTASALSRFFSPLAVRRDQMPRLLMLALLFTASSITLFEAYRFIPSGMAATIVYLYPIFTALTLIFFREYPSVKTMVAVVAAFCGVAILCLPGSAPFASEVASSASEVAAATSSGVAVATSDVASVTTTSASGAPNWRGILLSALSALSYSLFLIGIGKSRKVADLGVQTITVHALAIGAVVLLVMHLIEGGELLAGVTGLKDWLNLLGLAIFPTAIAMVGLSVATRRIGATRAAILGVFEPLTSIAFGILLFQEPFTLTTAIGMAICLCAVGFVRG